MAPRRVCLAALVLVVGLLGMAGSAGAAVRVQTVCFNVTNPAGTQSTLYGLRYTNGSVSSATPAIVLVHGIASSTANWDFTPSWSVARSLASAGYVVFSYDRLGYAKSPYDQPGGGETLTTQAHRQELHDVVGDVKSGSYSCSGPSGLPSGRVVIIGHSAGGWIVAGYPGQYHDVAAMVQADIPGSVPPPGGSSGGSFTPDPSRPDYFQFFQTRQNCEDFNIYKPGEVKRVVDIACTPPFLDSPFGEILDLGPKYAENDASIKLIGPTIPVLLTSGDHDTTDPPATAAQDYAYYKANCGCDVSQLLLPDTGHLFMAHKSLSLWLGQVESWLRGHGIAPR